MKTMPINSIESIKEAIATWWVGLFGGTAYYLYLVSKWQKFLMSMFCINIFLAFFIGYVAWQFIWPDMGWRDWLIAISWFSSFPILNFLERKWVGFITKFIEK